MITILTETIGQLDLRVDQLRAQIPRQAGADAPVQLPAIPPPQVYHIPLPEYRREKASAERTHHRRNSVLHFASFSGAAASIACSSNGAGGEHAQTQQQSTTLTAMMMPRRNAVLQTKFYISCDRICVNKTIENDSIPTTDDECDETVKDEDEELQLSSYDLDSLNTADHYKPVPTLTATTSMANPMASYACVTADHQTITDSSCRSSACGDELEDDDNAEGTMTFRNPKSLTYNFLHNSADTLHLACESDSSRKCHVHSDATVQQERKRAANAPADTEGPSVKPCGLRDTKMG
ncbi:hypothetical protein niasHT_038167 [Heterodera trifolii]|uniref:Uncharacterized protein n=1 Tax=Heterodera trifolii TaxID=157864 RepID=A0ABD2I3L5_9BILA